MGTTLTGTTPQDTYDSLIKVTDNGPISGTLKALSDGLGNDSTLSLSTTAASIAGTLAVTGNATFDTTTLVVDAANNRVGVGTASPSYQLDARGIAAVFNAGLDAALQPTLYLGHPSFTGTYLNKISTSVSATPTFQLMQFSVANGASTYADVMTLSGAGSVGIGTSSPANKLVVKAAGFGAIASFLDTADNGFVFKADAFNGFNAIDQTQQLIMNFGGAEKYRFNTDGVLAVGSGIQFPATQVASANANTLDDYEEGEWTMGVSFGGASVGVTYGDNTGTYTKIGRQVTVNGYIYISNKGSSTGAALITGLPFTQTGNLKNLSAASAYLVQIDYVSQYSVIGNTGTYLSMYEITEAGVSSALTDADFANNSEIAISFTYFV